MASNKFLISDSSTILKDKLDKVSAKLQGSIAASEFQTKEEYIVEAIKVLQEFYDSILEPRLEVPDLRADQLPDRELYNELWTRLLDDLTVLFKSLENVEGLTVANFNFITTESNRLTTRLKAISSKLGDYILYSLNPSKDAYFFKDSFNDLSKIEIGSSLLNSLPCEVNQEEGIVTLPIDLEKDSRVIVHETPVINPDSNGTVGNNQQLNAEWNGDLQVLLDNNPDTWFEYERVTTAAADTREPLVLDITLNLGEPIVINHIRVNPNNFGTRTVIQVGTIDTSLDGKVYTSIKDDIPIAGFTTGDEENIFSLAPSTSKFAGQGIYTFTPRKVKYIHFVFKQTEPYLISTPSGSRLRYAIGIRDLDIRALHFINEGELVSTRFEAVDEIRKVLLQTNQNPIQTSELASIKYFLSGDDGATWYEIQPKDTMGVSAVQAAIPEILDFNGQDLNSIPTSVPIQSLRLKMLLKREDIAFEEGETSALRKTITSRTELHEIPGSAPFVLTLNKTPVDGTVTVIDPLFGSRGIPSSPYVLGHAYDRLNMRKYHLPITKLPWPVKKVSDGGTPIPQYRTERVSADDWIFFEVGGERWLHASGVQSTWGTDDKVYLLDPNQNIVTVGNDTYGVMPADNEPITMYFDAERLFPSETEDDHIALLEFPTSANKKDMTIKRYDPVATVIEHLPKRASIVRLEHQDILDYSGITSVLEGSDLVAFVNGSDELLTSDNWSIDPRAGIIYFASPTPDDETLIVRYSYQPVYTLTEEEWDWASSSVLRDSVSIKEAAWKTTSVPEEYIKMTTGAQVFDLSQLSIVKGSLIITVTDEFGDEIDKEDTAFFREVNFKDGSTELGLQNSQMVATIPTLVPTGDIASFDLAATANASYPVYFSNTTIFATLVTNEVDLSVAGEYFIKWSTNEVLVWTDETIEEPGKITYYCTDTNFVDNGLYSVDYQNGKIYTQRPVVGTWICTAEYNYIDFRAEYRVARWLDPDVYEVDIANHTVTIQDNETLFNMTIPQGSLSKNQARYYLINYDSIEETREDILDLKELFTPVIKDYALKIITRSRIF